MNTIRIMTVVCNQPLKQSEIRLFRGAVIGAAGLDNSLFHNHNDGGFEYRYPMIQYRIIGGKATIVCINEGIEQIQALFSSGFIGGNLRIGNENRGPITIESIRQNEYSLGILEQPIQYHISRWLPLNQQNYKLWKQIEDDDEKIAKLNAILIGNILSFAKGIGWNIDHKIECVLNTESISTHSTQYKGLPHISFSLDFSANIFIPNGIGLGKGVSSNCGVISRPRRR